MEERLKKRIENIDDLLKRKLDYDNKNFLKKFFTKDSLNDDIFLKELDSLFDISFFEEIKSNITVDLIEDVIRRYSKLYDKLSYDKNYQIIDAFLCLYTIDTNVKKLLLHMKNELKIAEVSFANINKLLGI